MSWPPDERPGTTASTAETVWADARWVPVAALTAEVVRREQAEADVVMLRTAISADHATDPAWGIAQIATLAQAHRSDSETADQAQMESPNDAYDAPVDWEAVSRLRQERVEQAKRERDEARSECDEANAAVTVGVTRLVTLTAALEGLEREMRVLSATPIGWKTSAVDTVIDQWADRLAALRTL